MQDKKTLVALTSIHHTDAVFVEHFETSLNNCAGMWTNHRRRYVLTAGVYKKHIKNKTPGNELAKYF